MPSAPPQTIIFVPVQTAEWQQRAPGAPAMDVAVQRSWLEEATSVNPAPISVVSPVFPNMTAPDGKPAPGAPIVSVCAEGVMVTLVPAASVTASARPFKLLTT